MGKVNENHISLVSLLENRVSDFSIAYSILDRNQCVIGASFQGKSQPSAKSALVWIPIKLNSSQNQHDTWDLRQYSRKWLMVAKQLFSSMTAQQFFPQFSHNVVSAASLNDNDSWRYSVIVY